MTDIRQRLFLVLQRHTDLPFSLAEVEGLCRDALAEIERLEGRAVQNECRDLLLVGAIHAVTAHKTTGAWSGREQMQLSLEIMRECAKALGEKC